MLQTSLLSQFETATVVVRHKKPRRGLFSSSFSSSGCLPLAAAWTERGVSQGEGAVGLSQAEEVRQTLQALKPGGGGGGSRGSGSLGLLSALRSSGSFGGGPGALPPPAGAFIRYADCKHPDSVCPEIALWLSSRLRFLP